MAEHHKFAEMPLCLHGLKGQKCSQRFAGARPGMNQHITPMAAGGIKASAQKLDQLLLPHPGPDALSLWIGTEGKRCCCDDLDQEDESF